jgi:exodeoxyribonuclease VII large subunit
MASFGPLFDSDDDDPGGPPTWGVLEFNRAVEGALQDAFPGEFWIRGEIQGLARTRARKHWYFELVEKDPDGDAPLARVSIALLSWKRAGVEREMRAAPGFELDDDVEVRIRCQIGFYPPWGKFQLAMVGVDPAFTLGQMAANRERILRALAKDGLLERNAALPLPLVPQRVGLVTSVGSAAYNDFVDEIRGSDCGFQILACDARVQGAETESTVVAGIRTLARRKCDVIVVVRGGGSRSDLAGFDSESIARAIAVCPVPVLTGIGHEIDTSLADVVAHRDFKTPTACADFLVDHVHGAIERYEELWARIAEGAQGHTRDELSSLGHVARGVSAAARHAVQLRGRDLKQLRSALAREARSSLVRNRDRVTAGLQRVHDLVRLRLVSESTRVDYARRRLRPERLRRPLERRQHDLNRARHRLAGPATRKLREQSRRLDAVTATVRALDPQRVLDRGYALALDADGKAVNTVAKVRPGDRIELRLADGRIGTTVDRVEKSPAILNPEEKP